MNTKISKFQSTCPSQLIWNICQIWQILNFEKTWLCGLKPPALFYFHWHNTLSFAFQSNVMWDRSISPNVTVVDYVTVQGQYPLWYNEITQVVLSKHRILPQLSCCCFFFMVTKNEKGLLNYRLTALRDTS